MSICGTERSVRRSARLGIAGLVSLAVAASAVADDEPLRSEAEVTLGVRLYDIEDQDNDFVAGFWDQYRHTRGKDDEPPWFFDALHLDFGLARPDDTYLLRIERWSPNATNERLELDANHRGLHLDFDYRRYRSEELRVFPRGTYQDQTPPLFDTYATQFNPDASLGQIVDSNRRFWLRRTSVGGELRLRPDDFGLGIPVISQATLRSGFEERKGYRHDRFLLDAADEPSFANASFRGLRRHTDQEVTNVGGNIVLQLPVLEWTQDLDVSFESFREKASDVTFADIAAMDPTRVFAFGSGALRGFQFTPNTDRVTASSRSRLEVGPVALNASGFFSHLRQTDKAPLQRFLGLDKQELMTWSAHLGFDVPLGERFEWSGFAKIAERRNELDANDFAVVPISAILRRRTEVDAETELAFRPAAGALVATGYRYEWIDRNLRRPAANPARPPSLLEEGSERHALYVRGRARLMRRLQVAGELGWEYAPERDYPTDMTSTLYFDGRASYTLPRPWPITVALNGSVRDGHGSGRVLDAQSTETRKDLDRRQWNYTTSVAVVPTPGTSVSLSFTQHRDRRDLPYTRYDIPFTTPEVTFFANPDRIHYKSDVKTLAINAVIGLTDTVELRHYESVHWVSGKFDDESVNEIDESIVSLGWGIGWKATEGLELDFGYRLDQFLDDAERGTLSTDDVRHTFTLGATIGLDLFLD
jgi:hypothetical protein